MRAGAPRCLVQFGRLSRRGTAFPRGPHRRGPAPLGGRPHAPAAAVHALPSERLLRRALSSHRGDDARGDLPARRTGRLPSIVEGARLAYKRTAHLRSAVAQTRWARLMRLDKPIGTHLLFLPTAWGITLGAASVGDALPLYALTYTGAVIMRGAGCTMNDLWDEDIDKHVERTKSRPITSGEISTPAALAFLGAQLSAGLCVLLSLNNYAITVGAPSVIPVLLYPLAKRMTNYPQAVLGLTINWGALVGYAAASDSLGPAAFCLYGAGWCWTMVYDTVYAHQDKHDDARISVKSSALALGPNTRPVLAALTAAKIALLSGAGIAADLSMPYFAGVALAGAHLGRQVAMTDFENPDQCQTAFVSNEVTGTIIFVALVAGRLV